MVTLTIKADFGDVDRRLSALREDIRDKALPRALNRTIEQARTDMVREIRQEFNLPAAKVREKLYIRRAGFSRGQLRVEAALASSARNGRRSLNVINFQARQTPAGLTAKIKRQGGRKVVSKIGFIGNKGRTAFERVGKRRLPIRPLQTIDVPQMFNTRRINAAVVRKLREKFTLILEREIRFYSTRFSAR